MNHKIIIIVCLFLVQINLICAQTDGQNIEGKSVLTDLVTLKTTKSGNSDINNVPSGKLKNLVINTTGVVLSSSGGLPVVAGGYRPGTQAALFTAETSTAVVNIRYVAYVDDTNATDQGDATAYAFGDLTVTFISGNGRIASLTCFDGLGNARTASIDAPGGGIVAQRTITMFNQGDFSFVVRSDGRIGVVSPATVSYIFEFMGGT